MAAGLGWWHFRSDISLQCESVDPPARVSVQSSAWVCRVGGLLLQRLAVLVPEFLHSRALGKDRPNLCKNVECQEENV